MFAVVAGLSGQYAFDAVTKAFDRTGATIPPALAAVELTRETEQVLSAGPRMMNAATEEEVERLWKLATDDLKNVDRLVDRLRTAAIDPRALDGLSSDVLETADTLSRLKEAAIERVRAATRRDKLLNDTFSAYRDFGTAWSRSFADLQSQVLQLRTTLSLASSTQERRSAIDRFDLAVATLLSLEQIQREAGLAYEFVTRGASSSDDAHSAMCDPQRSDDNAGCNSNGVGHSRWRRFRRDGPSFTTCRLNALRAALPPSENA